MELSKHPEDIDFQKYWQILKRHKIPATKVFLGTVILATILALVSEKKYAAYGKLKFTKENTTSALIAEGGEKLGRLETLSSTATPVDTESEVIKSAPVVKEVIKKLNLTTKNGELITYENFLKNLSVKNIPGTDILSITYESSDSEEAKTIVNTVIEVYINKNIAINRTQAQAAREFIIQQLPKTEAELQATELKLKTFKEQNNIVNIDVETELAANKIGAIDQQINSVEVNLEKVNSQIAEIKHKLNITSQEAIALNTINDSSSIQQLLTKLKDVEDRLAVERSRFRETNPIILDLKDKKAELEKELQKRSQGSINLKKRTARTVFQTGDIQKKLAQNLVDNEVQRQSLTKELTSLQALKTSSQQRNNLIPQLQQRYQDLLRKMEIAQSAYKNLLQNLQQVQIAENQNVGNAQIVSEAVVGQYPVSTSRKLILAAGIGIGSVLYVITAFLLELKDPSFKTSTELRRSLDYKLLTSIPNLEQKDILGRNIPLAILPELQTTESPNSLISEAYRMLYTNLQFMVKDRDLKVITVTSSIPQEGKSTVSANLASTIAYLNQKVLLIDGDLHKPRQHLIWGVHNSIGLIEILQGEADLSKAIQTTPINPMLDILPAGLNYAEYLSLLRSERMSELISLLREQYDLVVIDTPPVLLFADTLTISKNTDGIVLVGRLGVSNPITAKNAKELLEQSEQRILGVVVNSVDNEAESYYKYAKDYEQDLQQQQQKLLSSSKNK
jgi:polysaccharide biosynthesis transport protein